MVAVNHMNHDVAQVNSSDLPILPGSFLYEKEPGYLSVCRLYDLQTFILLQVANAAARKKKPWI